MQLLGFLAAEFHFQPSELWEMDTSDLAFWQARAQEVAEQRKAARARAKAEADAGR